MPANRRQQTAQSPASPTTQSTAKYINKDGSKFITVPKVHSSGDSSETSPAMAQPQTKSNGQIPLPAQDTNGTTAVVNRKKQKRREKARQAEQAARQVTSGSGLPRDVPPLERYESQNGRYSPPLADGVYYSDDDSLYANMGSPEDFQSMPPVESSLKPSKKKGKSKTSGVQSQHGTSLQPHGQNGAPQKKIWNTSGPEERESIKEFWLSLGEEERRSLVKVEKDAVLKKMKEQQKHSCSCTVCGRKRVAIEEELEVLYDAYYEELEQYANNQHGDGPIPLATTRRFGPMNSLHPPNRIPPTFNGRQPSKARLVENFDDEDGDEEYSEDDADEEDYLSDEEPIEEVPRPSHPGDHANDFFNFGQSLTVKGGILTVADDLLKNDGKKFIEMMEQLAERRMAREEDAKEYSNLYSHPSSNRPLSPHHHTHNHGPPQDDDDYDDDEDGEDSYDSQEDDYDEEEMDTMTEEQRMEEGRRMFQIFAARMFEQRVLTAWKEKMAVERRQALLEEETNEALAEEQKKAKKAKEAQKKKEKAQQKKAALAEEKRKKDEAKAAEEAKLREAEEKKAEQARIKADEKRKKREAQKKAEEEERLRKEAEKQRRLQEQRDRQAELERKIRDAKDRERKEKEELRQKEKEAREAKEREVRERKERQDREKREVEAKIRAESEAKDNPKREDQATQKLAAIPQTVMFAKRPQQPTSLPMPPVGQPASIPASSHVPVVTPIIPKAPTPNRSAPTSQKDSSSVPQTPQLGKSNGTSPSSSTPLKMSPDPASNGARATSQQPFLHHPQATSPIHSALKGPPGGFQAGPFGGLQPMGMNAFPPGMPMGAPGFGPRMHQENMYPHQQPMGNPFRPMSGPNGISMPPGMNNMPMQQGRGFPTQHAPPGFPQPLQNSSNGTMPGIAYAFSSHKDGPPTQSHSRQHSASFDKSAFESGATQPIARPPPIARPSSVVQGLRSMDNDYDDVLNQLGSASLLDDSDEPLNAGNSNPGAGGRRASAALGMGRQPFQQLPQAPPGMDPYGFPSPHSSFNTWGAPNAFTPSSLPGQGLLGGWGMQPQSTFGAVGVAPGRSSQPRNAAVRQMLCDASKALAPSSSDGWISINAVHKEVEKLNGHRDEGISTNELIALCDTEGSQMNGGGSFDVRESDGIFLIRFQADPQTSNHRPVGAPGEIGSPITSHGPMSRFGIPGGY